MQLGAISPAMAGGVLVRVQQMSAIFWITSRDQ